ncbi:3550_t:CDS:1, partial [Gigaspora margarita]
YYKLDLSGKIAFWMFDYFKNGYGFDKKPTKEDKFIAIKSLEVAAKNKSDSLISYLWPNKNS